MKKDSTLSGNWIERLIREFIATSPFNTMQNDAGHAAIALMLVPNWTIVKSERFSYASSWSERHAVHAAGLGAFGLCDGLITAKGKTMRVGSVVAKISIEPTPDPITTTGPIASFSLRVQ